MDDRRLRGEGEVAITPQDQAAQSSDINLRTFGLGGSGQLLERGATTLRLKGEALQTELEVGDSTG